VTTLAGGQNNLLSGLADGYGTSSLFSSPNAITIDTSGILYVGDLTPTIRMITTSGTYRAWLPGVS
jgi:hypothetical protein